MNWDQMQGNWKELREGVKEEWNQLTDRDLDRIGGRRDELIERITERYGIEPERAEREVESWERTIMV